MRHFILSVLLLVLTIFACTNESTESSISEKLEPLDIVLKDMMKAHGKLGNYQFDFRGNLYTFWFDKDEYQYTKQVVNDSTLQLDTLSNIGFSRTTNGEKLNLTKIEQDRYAESLNSVVYFVCLPLKLNDPAVKIALRNPVKIKQRAYDVIEVTFNEDGGGTDHDDVFMYWINQETHQVDYLAYQYAVNGGGVRFRSAFNSRMIGAMRFQDYVNYGAPVGTLLSNLPLLYQDNLLEELSVIATENVIQLPLQN